MVSGKVAILAIGTEVTSGQIINGNSAWLSERMEKLGFESVLHLSVADDREMMLKGLRICVDHAEHIFTTGGLGPTTDDFTREIVAEYLQVPLEFDPISMEKIQKKMAIMGRAFLESQKRQCSFPKGAKVLVNSEGTANGFLIEKPEFKLWVLPGPPNEVQAIWNDEIVKIIGARQSKQKLLKWNCMGKPEAELAEIVESAVLGSTLKTGYRLNAPYVEVKIWTDDVKENRDYISKVEEAIRPWTVLVGDESVIERFLKKTTALQVEIYDEATDGLLSERLMKEVRRQKIKPSLRITSARFHDSDPSDRKAFQIHLGPIGDDGYFQLVIGQLETKHQMKLKSPFVHRLENERSRLAAAELALLEACKFLN